MHIANPIVRNAIAVVNAPYSGNLYKCPHCHTKSQFTKEGVCGKCKQRLTKQELGKFLTERITREMRQHPGHPIYGITSQKLTGRIDAFPSDIRHMAKHQGALKRLGMTLASGEYGYTTEGSQLGRRPSDQRVSIVHGRHVAITRKDEKNKGTSRVKTHYVGGGAARREKAIHKETRRR